LREHRKIFIIILVRKHKVTMDDTRFSCEVLAAGKKFGMEVVQYFSSVWIFWFLWKSIP